MHVLSLGKTNYLSSVSIYIFTGNPINGNTIVGYTGRSSYPWSTQYMDSTRMLCGAMGARER